MANQENPESPEIYYEMLWDCAQCSTKGLLGTSQRHCPVCGAAQDPKKRYFPEPGQEVEAKNHRYSGVDWHCAYCNTPNSAAAAFCTNCGAGKDGTKPVALVTDKAAPPPPPVAKPAAKSTTWRWVVGFLVLALVVWIGLFSSKRDTQATVTQRDWQREIQIERFAPVGESAWRESVPMNAYAVSCNREVRSTRQIPDGQDCHDVRIDRGDGSFVKQKECTPRYRSEPVYGERCRYQVNRWQVARSLKASTANSLMPTWPAVNNLSAGSFGNALDGGMGGNREALGAERPGARSENYVLTLTIKGKTTTCNVPEAVWRKYEDGSTATIQVRMTGGVDCASLQ